MFYYHIFSFIWTLAFFEACCKFVFGSAVAIWYYKNGEHPVWSSYTKLIRYHLGSVAFGSFIVTLLYLLVIVVEYLHKNIKESGQSNQCIDFLFRCI